MNIIFGRSNADALRDRYLILELETLDAGDQKLECFCVVSADDMPSKDLATVGHYSKLHQTFVDNLNQQNYVVCRQIAQHLYGQFGGELDSFYSTVLERTTPPE